MNVLVIGYGSIAKKHVAAFQSLGVAIQFYALRSSANAASEECVTNIFSWSEVPHDTAFAIISNPTSLHTIALQECISRNIPVMMEKPVSNLIGELGTLQRLVSSVHLPTYVACNLRFLPVLQFLKKEFQHNEKRINELNCYCGSSLPSWRPNSNYKTSYSANEARGGGVHLDLFHELDYLCWIFGFPEHSMGINRRVSSIEIEAADYSHYLLYYREYTGAVTLNYYRKDPKRQIEIVFDTGTWTVDLLKGSIIDEQGQNIFSNTQVDIMATYKLQAAHMLAVVRGLEMSINPIPESLKILEICLGNEKLS